MRIWRADRIGIVPVLKTVATVCEHGVGDRDPRSPP